MGWLRYRVGEEGRVVQPQQWQSHKPLLELEDARTRTTLQNDLDGEREGLDDRSAKTPSSLSDSNS